MRSEKSNKRLLCMLGMIFLLVFVGIGSTNLTTNAGIASAQSGKADYSSGDSAKMRQSALLTNSVGGRTIQLDGSKPLLFPRSQKDSLNSNLSTSESPPLVNQIKACLSEVESWNYLVNVGVVMHKSIPTDFDTWILRMGYEGNWIDVLRVKYYAERAGYSSNIIDNEVKLALSNIPMFKKYSLPKTNPAASGYFSVYDRIALWAYSYARKYDWETGKWNETSGFLGLKSIRDRYGRAFYECNPDTQDAKSQRGARWHEAGNLMDCFFTFYELGEQDSLQCAVQEWQWINKQLWSGDHFNYVPEIGWAGWEFSGMSIFPSVARLHLNGARLGNWTRVTTDLQCRYINRLWNSPQWHGEYEVVQHHNPGNRERRLDGTLDAWILLQTFYPLFNEGNQTNMRNMLEGNDATQAWTGLGRSDLKHPNTNRFRLSSSCTYSDEATAQAALCLFLTGISVENGSGLAIPLASNRYNCLNFRHFECDLEKNRIKIPVWSGTILRFLYGNKPTNHYFSTTGIYEIYFDPRWNSISNVTRVSDLVSNEIYLLRYGTPTETIPPFSALPIVGLLIFIGIALVCGARVV